MSRLSDRKISDGTAFHPVSPGDGSNTAGGGGAVQTGTECLRQLKPLKKSEFKALKKKRRRVFRSSDLKPPDLYYRGTPGAPASVPLEHFQADSEGSKAYKTHYYYLVKNGGHARSFIDDASHAVCKERERQILNKRNAPLREVVIAEKDA